MAYGGQAGALNGVSCANSARGTTTIRLFPPNPGKRRLDLFLEAHDQFAVGRDLCQLRLDFRARPPDTSADKTGEQPTHET